MLKVGNSYDFIFLWTRIKRKKRGFVCLGFFHLVRVCVLSFSRVRPFSTLWTEALQAPLSVGFSGKKTGVGCHSLLQGIFPTQWRNLRLLCLLQAGRFLTLEPQISFTDLCIVQKVFRGNMEAGARKSVFKSSCCLDDPGWSWATLGKALNFPAICFMVCKVNGVIRMLLTHLMVSFYNLFPYEFSYLRLGYCPVSPLSCWEIVKLC